MEEGKTKNKELTLAIAITLGTVAVGLFILFLKSRAKKDFTGLEQISYLTKVVSILWLVLIPIVDYWKWLVETPVKKARYVFPFILLMIITISYIALPFFTISNDAFCRYFLTDNYYFFSHTIFSLCILALADYFIIEHLKTGCLSRQQEIIELQKSIRDLEESKLMTMSYKEKEKLKKLEEEECHEKIRLERYQVTFRYADKVILIPLGITFCLYLTLASVFGIDGLERPKYDIFFEGAHVFSLIISSVIYFIIVMNYGSQAIYTDPDGQLQQP